MTLPINTIQCADCLEVMKGWPDQCIQTCVTSPPYWGLRSYGHWEMQTVWGTLDDFCPPRKHKDRWKFRLRWRAAEKGGVFNRDKTSWIGAYGLEPTPELYIKHTVEVFRGVWRVLRDDGTLWLNLGDTYAQSSTRRNRNGISEEFMRPCREKVAFEGVPVEHGLKPKDLCGIPWRVALALQADGWYLRQDIIWSKPNPMPESVTDRCTKAHEYIFLLTKKPRYFYDAEAIKEAADPKHKARYNSEFNVGVKELSGQGRPDNASNTAGMKEYSGTRNKRSVWTVTTQPCKEAHFATFPPKLIEPCILAGTSQKGCCPECGAPSERVVEKVDTGATQKMPDGMATHKGDHGSIHKDGREKGKSGNPVTTNKTTGWRPTCECDFYRLRKDTPAPIIDEIRKLGLL